LPTIRFTKHPAYVTVTDGVSMAATYWRDSWTLWILPVAAIVLVYGLAEIVFGSSTLDSRTLFGTGSPGRTVTFAALAPAQIAGPLATGLVGLVANWFLTAIAVAGLRNRPVTASWVVVGGLRSIGAALLIGIVVAAVIAVYIILTAITPLVLITLLGVLPAALYVSYRLSFWTLAVFDEMGVMDAARFSWHISQASVLRILGWGIVGAIIVMAVVLLALIPTFLMAFTGMSAIGIMLSTALTETCAVFALMLSAVLYESQRWRYAPPAVPATPVAPYPPSDEVGPIGPPPPPAPPTSPWG
jgi:hypothetical protein